MCNENCGSDGDEIDWEREDDEIVKKVAVSRLFCLNRIEMEKTVFFTFLPQKQTIHLANTSLSVPKVCI